MAKEIPKHLEDEYRMTRAEQEMVDLYAAIMEEVKVRLSSIETAAMGKTGLIGPIAREFCFLQLRMLCELIALACLVAHGDIKETTKLRKLWAADKIIKALETLHPEFYPTPIRTNVRPDPEPNTFEKVTNAPILTKADLIKLYGKVCGDTLHRGSLKKLLSPDTPVIRHFNDVVDWSNKIAKLLAFHAMQAADKKHMIVTILYDRDSNYRVCVKLGQRYLQQ